jgi:hypothetical protein
MKTVGSPAIATDSAAVDIDSATLQLRILIVA